MEEQGLIIPETVDSDKDSVSSAIPNMPSLALVVEKINSPIFTPIATSSYLPPNESFSSSKNVLPPIGESKSKRYVDEFGFYADSSDSIAKNSLKKTKEDLKELQQLENEWLLYINNWDVMANKKKSRVNFN